MGTTSGQRARSSLVVAVLSSGLAGLSGCVLYGWGGDDHAEPDVDSGPRPDAAVDAGIDAPFLPDAPLPIDAPSDASPPAPPTIDLTAPANNTLITHHDAVVMTAFVTGNPLAGIDLTVDGVGASADLTVTGLPQNGDCFAGCTVTLSWNADKMFEGNHAVTLTAVGTSGETASDGLTFRFEDAPEVVFVRPQTNERRGASSVAIEVRVIDRGPAPINTSLAIDGVTVQSPSFPDCRFGCTLTRTWDTATLPAGNHPLRAVATDAAGRSTTTQLDVAIGDIPYVSQISVTGESDFGSLEVEVHIRDAATNAWLGCTGMGQGMQNVDDNNTTYNVVGWFSDAQSRTVGIEQLAGRTLRLEVSEDDDNQCPGTNGGGDDPIGTSPSIAAASLANLNTAFGNVLALSTRHGRPLSR
jgi:hypothetical protein